MNIGSGNYVNAEDNGSTQDRLIILLAAAIMSKIEVQLLKKVNGEYRLDVEMLKKSFDFPLGLEIPPPHPYVHDSNVIAYIPTLSSFYVGKSYYECTDPIHRRGRFEDVLTQLERDGFFRCDMKEAFFSILWIPMGEDTPHTSVLTYFSFTKPNQDAPVNTFLDIVWDRIPVVNTLLSNQSAIRGHSRKGSRNDRDISRSTFNPNEYLKNAMLSRSQVNEYKNGPIPANALLRALRAAEPYVSDPIRPQSTSTQSTSPLSDSIQVTPLLQPVFEGTDTSNAESKQQAEAISPSIEPTKTTMEKQQSGKLSSSESFNKTPSSCSITLKEVMDNTEEQQPSDFSKEFENKLEDSIDDSISDSSSSSSSNNNNNNNIDNDNAFENSKNNSNNNNNNSNNNDDKNISKEDKNKWSSNNENRNLDERGIKNVKNNNNSKNVSKEKEKRHNRKDAIQVTIIDSLSSIGVDLINKKIDIPDSGLKINIDSQKGKVTKSSHTRGNSLQIDRTTVKSGSRNQPGTANQISPREMTNIFLYDKPLVHNNAQATLPPLSTSAKQGSMTHFYGHLSGSTSKDLMLSTTSYKLSRQFLGDDGHILNKTIPIFYQSGVKMIGILPSPGIENKLVININQHSCGDGVTEWFEPRRKNVLPPAKGTYVDYPAGTPEVLKFKSGMQPSACYQVVLKRCIDFVEGKNLPHYDLKSISERWSYHGN